MKDNSKDNSKDEQISLLKIKVALLESALKSAYQKIDQYNRSGSSPSSEVKPAPVTPIGVKP